MYENFLHKLMSHSTMKLTVLFKTLVVNCIGVKIVDFRTKTVLTFQTYRDLFLNIADTNVAALVLSSICMIIIWCTKEYLNPPVKKRIKAPIPIDLIIVSSRSLFRKIGRLK